MRSQVKKRVASILHRFLQRYGNPKLRKGAGASDESVHFARHFQQVHAATCLQACVGVLQLRVDGRTCPDRVATLCLNYVEESVKFEPT